MIVQPAFNPLPAVSEPHSTAAEAPKATPAAQTAPRPEPTRQQIDAAVDSINRSLQSANHSLKFSVDGSTDRVIVKVVDEKTGETLRQIPSKETLAIAESIDQYQEGLKKGLILKQEV